MGLSAYLPVLQCGLLNTVKKPNPSCLKSNLLRSSFPLLQFSRRIQSDFRFLRRFDRPLGSGVLGGVGEGGESDGLAADLCIFLLNMLVR